MSDLLSLLSLGSAGIAAQNTGVGVASNNVANVNTAGYSRQRVDLEALVGMPLVGGVRSGSPDRLQDNILAGRIRVANGSLSMSTASAEALSDLEQRLTGGGSSLGEQLSAMEMMAVDPVQRILAPRFWGGVITMPLLAAVFNAVGILGGWVVGVTLIGVDPGAFWSQMQGGVDVFKDVGNGVIKSVVFGVAVTFIAVLQGYAARPTPEGVARATTRTVVTASLAVLALDFVLTAMMFSI